MKDRFTGVLLGLACGEGGARDQTGPAPVWGVETAMAVELAEAVGEVGAYHPEAALERYRAWGGGPPVQAAETGMPVRSVALALAAIADDDRILGDTLVDTRLTHRGDGPGYAAVALNLLVARFAFGERDRDAALRQVAEVLHAEAPDLAAFLVRSAEAGFPTSAPEGVPVALAAGLAAFLRGETLEAALSGEGGPGTLAVAGALAGAWFGEWGIPAARRARLRDADRIAAAAEGLFRVVRLGSPWTER
ncbi:MAG: hypothetical protein HY722_11810 [Planctomycetes bacterium]|nr:hypothetical protein [Planctomycetota bacterium]